MLLGLQIKKTVYLPSAVFTAQVLVGPRKQLKQIIQIERNILRIPTGWRQVGDKLAMGHNLTPIDETNGRLQMMRAFYVTLLVSNAKILKAQFRRRASAVPN